MSSNKITKPGILLLILSAKKLMLELQLDSMNTKLVIRQVLACLRPKVGLLNRYSWNVWRLYLCILILVWGTLLTSCRRPQYDLLFQILTQGPQFSCGKALIVIFYVEERDKNSGLKIIEMMMLIRQIWSADSLILTYGHTCTDTTDWKW